MTEGGCGSKEGRRITTAGNGAASGI